jgi:hypothetical protein
MERIATSPHVLPTHGAEEPNPIDQRMVMRLPGLAAMTTLPLDLFDRSIGERDS